MQNWKMGGTHLGRWQAGTPATLQASSLSCNKCHPCILTILCSYAALILGPAKDKVYLGGFVFFFKQKTAYDIAAIKFRSHEANTNYNISNYEQELLHFDEVNSNLSSGP